MNGHMVTTGNSVNAQRMGEAEQQAQRGMYDLAVWCMNNVQLIEQGRVFGFSMGVSPAMKDLIAIVCADADKAARINGNLLDLPR
jgi:hypothetical protein